MRTRLDMALDGRGQAASALFTRDVCANQMGLEDYEDGLTDALTNLMHFADRYEIDFDLELERARRHHAVESTYGWNEEPGLDPKEAA
jgi:hypothetical protein